MRAFEVPEGNKTSKGRAIQNMINLPLEDKVRAFIKVNSLTEEDYINNNYIVMCTKRGVIKKTVLEAYSRPRANGINAITVREGDTLMEAVLVGASDQLMVASKAGKVVRFNNSDVRDMGRTASGVRAITLAGATDEVIGMIVIPANNPPQILVVSEKGYGKRSDVESYRQTRRGAKGVKTINVTDKTGQLVAIKAVTDENDLMIITTNGIIIRLRISDLRVMGRATQGVRLISLDESAEIGAVTTVETDPEEEVVAVDGTVDTSMADGADEPESDEGPEDGTDVESENDEIKPE
jgi:DNA gyrase subunit A